jgi:hypothetical protein
MKRLAPVMVCAALIGVGFASIAAADGDPVGDARGDNSGGGINRDLKGATHGHQGKFLKHGISSFGKQIPTDGLNLYINVNRSAAPEYVIGDNGSGPAVRRTSDGAVTGPLTIIQVSETKLRFLFKPSAIGKPKAYGWFVQFESNKGDVEDRAPNAGYNKHRLAG